MQLGWTNVVYGNGLMTHLIGKFYCKLNDQNTYRIKFNWKVDSSNFACVIQY